MLPPRSNDLHVNYSNANSAAKAQLSSDAFWEKHMKMRKQRATNLFPLISTADRKNLIPVPECPPLMSAPHPPVLQHPPALWAQTTGADTCTTTGRKMLVDSILVCLWLVSEQWGSFLNHLSCWWNSWTATPDTEKGGKRPCRTTGILKLKWDSVKLKNTVIPLNHKETNATGLSQINMLHAIALATFHNHFFTNQAESVKCVYDIIGVILLPGENVH